MPYVIDATVAGASANSYVTVEEADAIVSEVFDILTALDIDTSGWLALGSPSTNAKAIALVMAAKRIDGLPWLGRPLTTTQALACPRVETGIVAIDALEGASVPEDYKWVQVADACALLNARSQSAQRAESGVSSESFGEKSVTYRAGTSSLVYSDEARRVAIASGLIHHGVASLPMLRS